MEGKQIRFDKKWLIWLLLAFIPWVQWQTLADPTQLTRLFLYQLFCLPLLYISFTQRQYIQQLPHPLWSALLLLWVGFYAFSLTQAHNPHEAYYTLSKIGVYAAGAWLLSLLYVNKLISFKHVAVAVSVASVFSLALLLSELLEVQQQGTQLWHKKNLYVLHTAFGHKNLYSSFQLLCLPFIAILLLGENKWLKFLGSLFILLVVVSIVLMQTKAVLAGMAISFFFCVGMYRITQSTSSKWLWRVVFGLFFMAAGFLYVIKQHPEWFTVLLSGDTAKERVLLWKNSYQMWLENPWRGVGAGNWQIYFPKYGLGNFMQTNYLVSDGYTTFQRPHNDLIWAACETGILGALVYLLVLVLPIYWGYKSFKQQGKGAYTQLLLVFALVSYVFVALVDFPLERAEHQLLWALLAAFLVPGKSLRTGFKSILLLIPFALLVGAIYYTFHRFPNEVQAKKIAEAQATGNWQKLLLASKKIHGSYYSIDNFSLPIQWYVGVAHFSMGNREEANKAFQLAYDINPYQIHVLNNMASINELAGKHTLAISYYDQLLHISPKQPDALLNKSAALFNDDKKLAAMRCLYQFTYDEGNTQFLTYLHVIGTWYMEEKAKNNPRLKAILPAPSASCPQIIKDIFRTNQQQKRTFEEINFFIYEP